VKIRYRLAVASAAVTLVLFGVAGFLFVRSFRDGLVDSLDQGLGPQVSTLARQARAGDVSLDDRSTIATSEVVAQVLDGRGRVLEATKEAGRQAVIDADTIARARGGRTHTNVSVGSEPEPFRVVAAPVRGEGTGPGRIVLVGTSMEATDAAVARVERAAIIGGSAAVLLAAVGAWLLAGAALRPVDRMRRQAEAISEHDMTARLNVPSTRDELAALSTTMNALLARLQTSLDRQRNFVADAGHELRTPLSVLQTELELAARPTRTRKELVEAVAQAGREAERLSGLADELLFLARSDVAGTTIQRESVEVEPLLERSAEAIRTRAREHDVVVRVEAHGASSAWLDADLVRRALDNLLDNAVRYSPPGSVVTVSARATDTRGLEIQVEDAGPGFSDAFLPHAFERFRRADDARTRDDGGAGLGLSIVLAIAQAHGGTATASNRNGGGAVVTLALGDRT
jgi:hypothetical protein